MQGSSDGMHESGSRRQGSWSSSHDAGSTLQGSSSMVWHWEGSCRQGSQQSPQISQESSEASQIPSQLQDSIGMQRPGSSTQGSSIIFPVIIPRSLLLKPRMRSAAWSDSSSEIDAEK